MYTIAEMTNEDYDQSIELWRHTEGLALSDADSRESIQYYLARNPGMSYVCKDGEAVIGTILGGHDGRRGYIYHVAVDQAYRGKSIGKQLVRRSLNTLNEAGISKCHIMVIADNEIGNRFWAKTGWQKRDGILLFSSQTQAE